MLTCEGCRELLLEADVDALRRDAAGPLGDHLRECASCGRLAQRILADHERLTAALTAVEGRYVPATRGGERPDAPRPRRAWDTRVSAWRAAALLLPAAAVVGALFLARSGDDAAPLGPDPAELYAALHPAGPLVETPPGIRAAVITTDQAMTLVLLYPGGDR